MKFSYFKFPLKERSDFFGTSVLKPIIPVQVTFGSKSVNYDALIDSGADFCIFDGEIGEILGLDIRMGKLQRFGGIQDTGPSEAFLHEVVLKIGGWPYKTVVGFSKDISRMGYGILGQKGFFDIFTVKFDLQTEDIELKERK